MDWFSIILGTVATAFGLYILYSRSQENYTSLRLQSLKNMFGENGGDKAHLFTYGIIPIILGVMMFLKAFGITA